jgi:hypothetical protein
MIYLTICIDDMSNALFTSTCLHIFFVISCNLIYRLMDRLIDLHHYLQIFHSFNFERTWRGCFRNASCALILISTFLWLSLVRFLCWWTVSPRGFHPPSSQCFGNDMVYYYIYYRNLQFLNNVNINQTNVILLQASITVPDFGYSC